MAANICRSCGVAVEEGALLCAACQGDIKEAASVPARSAAQELYLPLNILGGVLGAMAWVLLFLTMIGEVRGGVTLWSFTVATFTLAASMFFGWQLQPRKFKAPLYLLIAMLSPFALMLLLILILPENHR